MGKPRLLDLFCGAGGAGEGYRRAGFEVVGVDIEPQPRYPFEFHQADALDMLREVLYYRSIHGVAGFDAIHASPPCQAHTALSVMWNAREHPNLIPDTRHLLKATRLPYMIENVVAGVIVTVFANGSSLSVAPSSRPMRCLRLATNPATPKPERTADAG